jgi:hypothetical protein
MWGYCLSSNVCVASSNDISLVGANRAAAIEIQDFIFCLVPAITLNVTAIDRRGDISTLTLGSTVPDTVGIGSHFCLDCDTENCGNGFARAFSVFEVQHLHTSAHAASAAAAAGNSKLCDQIIPKNAWPKIFKGNLRSRGRTMLTIEVSDKDRNEFKRDIRNFEIVLSERLRLPSKNVTVVEFEQEFRAEHGDRLIHCPRAVIKISAPKSLRVGQMFSTIYQIGYKNNLFCHRAQFLAMQALLSNKCQAFNECGCGKVYLDMTSKSNKSSVFAQFDNDQDLVEHFVHFIRNLFAHGSEKEFASESVRMLAHEW